MTLAHSPTLRVSWSTAYLDRLTGRCPRAQRESGRARRWLVPRMTAAVIAHRSLHSDKGGPHGCMWPSLRRYGRNSTLFGAFIVAPRTSDNNRGRRKHARTRSKGAGHVFKCTSASHACGRGGAAIPGVQRLIADRPAAPRCPARRTEHEKEQHAALLCRALEPLSEQSKITMRR